MNLANLANLLDNDGNLQNEMMVMVRQFFIFFSENARSVDCLGGCNLEQFHFTSIPKIQ